MDDTIILAKDHTEPVIDWLVWDDGYGVCIAYNPRTDTNRVHVVSLIDGVWTSAFATYTPQDAYDLYHNRESVTVGKSHIWHIVDVLEADERQRIALVKVDGSEKPYQVVSMEDGFWKPYFRSHDDDEAMMVFEYRNLGGEYLIAPVFA